MEQIYYTQCPVGYGLGASNGFQVKRLSRGYPMSGDFRHLGMKAFPGGGRTLAPPSLRYRRDGEVAEVAWLTPRANEYETERGLWGRPGGHFAHGLRLGADDLKAIGRWPAGLFDGPNWVRADREPSRGRLPDEFELSTASLSRSPSFAAVAPLADRLGLDRLAGLLTAVARVAREGRTLFLIDEADRLGPLVALLTFGFPERFRDDLTFSTYHDRPEELPGFRISGTIPMARPNKPALTAQGIVADLILGTFEPRIEPSDWARTLAGWLIRHDAVDEADWSATEARVRGAKIPPGESFWSEEWLGSLYAYPADLRSKIAPSDPAGWTELAGFAGWLRRSGLAEEWVRPRDPAWWLDAAGPAKHCPEARAALVAHVLLRDAWRGESRASGWGEVVATYFRDAEPAERDESIASILQVAPKSARPSFARSLLRGLTPIGADAVLDHLRADETTDRAMLLPLEAGAAVVAILEGADPAGLESIVTEARDCPGATAGVLDAIESGISDRPESLVSFAAIARPAFDPEAPGESREGIAWALRRGRSAANWLAPGFRPILAEPGRQATWISLRDRTAEDLRPALARAVLAIAADDGLPDEAFRWGVEGLLLPLAPRPSDPAWADLYLKKTPWVDLFRRLTSADYHKLGLLDWIKQARGRGELSDEQAGRVDSCLAYARALKSGDPKSLGEVEFPEVTPAERGKLFGQLLTYLGGGSAEGLTFVLGYARQAWPDAFQPGAAGLRGLAAPLARFLAPSWNQHARWFAGLSRMIEALGIDDGPLRGSEPDGLAAEVVAAATRLDVPDVDRWKFRTFLLKDDQTWRILAVDARRALADDEPIEVADILRQWIKELPLIAGRVFELLLNASDGSRLAYGIALLVPDLATLPVQPWWDHGEFPGGRDDFRDGFTRLVPIAPLPLGANAPVDLVVAARHADDNSLSQLMGWVQGKTSKMSEPDPFAPIAINDEPEADPSLADLGPPHLSELGRVRWACVLALTYFKNTHPANRWRIIWDWEKALPLALLPIDDRHRFVAWLIMGLQGDESNEISRLARWLWKVGIRDFKRLGDWPEELAGLVEVPDELKLYRSSMNKNLRNELVREIREGQATKGGRAPTPRPV